MRKLITQILITATLLATGTAVAAQTATPAPSKTPTVPPTEATEDAQEQEETDTPRTTNSAVQSFTQSDLSVLIGNVQRPNGMTWIDDHLYSVCTGDWTLYEISTIAETTETFVYGVQNAHALYVEETEEGFLLWVPDYDRNTLFTIDHQRSAPAVVTTDSLDGPWGITRVTSDVFLVSNLRGNNIVSISREGEVHEVITGLRAPAGVATDGEYVYIANNGSARRAIEWIGVNDLELREPDDERAEDESTSEASDDDEEEPVLITPTDGTNPLVQGLQNTSNLVYAEDGYLYFTYALGTRGIVGRVDPERCRDGGCSNEEVEIVVFTELPAPLSGLTITPDMRLYVHAIYRPEIYWVDLNR